MASFELKILTEDPAELKGLVDKLCSDIMRTGGAVPPQPPRTPTERAATQITKEELVAHTLAAIGNPAEPVVVTAQDPVSQEVADAVRGAMPAPVADRDSEGLKRDARIHSDAAEPFKTDGTWKRKRNTPDDTYDEVYEELAREAHAVGLYKGPLLGQFELEARVVDTGGPYYWAHDETDVVGVCQTWEELAELQKGEPLIDPIGKEAYDSRLSAGATVYVEGPYRPVAEQQAAPAPVVEQQAAPAPAPVAPAPQAAPAPVAPTPAGLSAQVSSSEERCKSLLTSMVKKVGPAVAVAALRMYGATAVTMLTPEQRESFCDVAEALLGDADATSANGSDKLAEIAVLLGVAV